jgi:beta-N-acetylhexosaminidase
MVVSRYAAIFIEQMHKEGVLTSLKHFPGHGSSVGDTHKGFVDVTHDWQEKELEPYKLLMGMNMVDTVMVAHVFNANLDEKYPASLSYKTVSGLLRNEMGYGGVVITDDLQMNAIDTKYGLKETLRLAINAGDDILLFGNQLNRHQVISAKKLIEIVKQLISAGKIDQKKIDQANERIERLKIKLKTSGKAGGMINVNSLSVG